MSHLTLANGTLDVMPLGITKGLVLTGMILLTSANNFLNITPVGLRDTGKILVDSN